MGKKDFSPSQWRRLRRIGVFFRNRSSETLPVEDEKILNQVINLGSFYKFRKEINGVLSHGESGDRWGIQKVREIAAGYGYGDKFADYENELRGCDGSTESIAIGFLRREEGYLMDHHAPGNALVTDLLRKICDMQLPVHTVHVENQSDGVILVSSPSTGSASTHETSNTTRRSLPVKIKKSSAPHKRRKKFTDGEKQAIYWGVQRHGRFWSEIKKDPQFEEVLRKRTNVQIKDCFRTMQKKGEAPAVQAGHVVSSRTDFTEEENDAILNGVEKYRDGGNQIMWGKILEDHVYGTLLAGRSKDSIRSHYRQKVDQKSSRSSSHILSNL